MMTGIKTRWPDEDTGKNSVKPCTAAIKIKRLSGILGYPSEMNLKHDYGQCGWARKPTRDSDTPKVAIVAILNSLLLPQYGVNHVL